MRRSPGGRMRRGALQAAAGRRGCPPWYRGAGSPARHRAPGVACRCRPRPGRYHSGPPPRTRACGQVSAPAPRRRHPAATTRPCSYWPAVGFAGDRARSGRAGHAPLHSRRSVPGHVTTSEPAPARSPSAAVVPEASDQGSLGLLVRRRLAVLGWLAVAGLPVWGRLPVARLAVLGRLAVARDAVLGWLVARVSA
jgi:hypothetical protein